MKHLTDDLYEISAGVYAERRGKTWVISDEASEVLDGPFSSLEALNAKINGEPMPAEALGELDSTDLVTLREAADHLPMTHQALFAARSRGTLKVDPVITARSTTLYSLRALKEAYDR